MEDMLLTSFEVESKLLASQEMRLNASSFSPDAANALALVNNLKNKSIVVDNIGDIVDRVFYPSRFKREYSQQGSIFLSSKDILDLLPRGKRIANAERIHFVQPGWILITRSGSVGRAVLVDKFLSKVAISEHAIRIVPNNVTPIHYLYAYLVSKIGLPLITKNVFGGVVEEIEPNHIASIPIPRIPQLEAEITTRVIEAHRLREEAQGLLLESKNMMYSDLGLPRLNEKDVSYVADVSGKTSRSFEIEADELESRLDASYHIPLVHLAINNLKMAGSGVLKKLGDISDTFVPPRFKRAYVENASEGIPLLQGTHIPQSMPRDVKYIWKGMNNLSKYVVRKNWLLLTCSGTIGRTSLVRDYWNGWAATNHLLRILPDESEIHPGYLTAFLLSDYGQVQSQRLVYGGVVDEIGEAGELFKNILILKPTNTAIENKIGNLIFEAFDKRDEASQIEDLAVKLLELKLNEASA